VDEPGAPTEPRPARLARLAWTGRHLIAATTISALASHFVLAVQLPYPHPSGGDGGQWLGIAHAYLGTGVSSIAPLNYPPVFFLMLSALWIGTGNPVAALHASIAIIAFLLPFSAFASYVLITRDRRGALLFCALVAFCFPFFEMLDWGAYPSLLSFVFFLPALAFMVRSSLPGAARREPLLLGLFAALTVLTHPLTALLFGVGAVCYFVLLQASQPSKPWFVSLLKHALPLFGIFVAPYYLARVALSGSSASSGGVVPGYLLSIPAYRFDPFFFPLVPWTWRNWFPFTSDFAALLIAVVSLLALYPLGAVVRARSLPPGVFRILRPLGRERAMRSVLLFQVTLLPALLIPLAMWKSNVYTDYSRFSFFACFPTAALAAALGSRLLDPGALRGALEWIAARSRRLAALVARASTADPEKTSNLSRLSRIRPLRLAPLGALWIVATLLLSSYAAFSIDYHAKTAAYYSLYNEPADVALTRWAGSNTPPQELFVLAPGFDNDFWFEGLSGRRAIGYTWDHLVYYESQAILNRDLIHIFQHRYGAAGGSLELVTPGGGDWRPTRFRLMAYDSLGTYVALDLIDSESYLVFVDGSRESFVGFSETGLGPDGSGSAARGFQVTSALSADGPRLKRVASALPDGVTLRFEVSGSSKALRSVVLTVRPAAPSCGISAEAGGVSIGATGFRGRCFRTLVGGSPSISAGWGKVSGTLYAWLTVPLDSSGAATLSFRSPDAQPSIPAPSGLIDAAEIAQKFGPCHFVTLLRSTGSAPMLVSELGLPVAYRDSKYLVVRSPEARAQLGTNL
jgi:hypothetical protein